MTSHFRNFHLTRILEESASSSLPLDSFLRKYFRAHRAIGSHDRRFIAEAVYKMARWKGLVEFTSPKGATTEELTKKLLSLEPKNYLDRETIPLHIRLSFPFEYFSLLEKSLGKEKAKHFCLVSNEEAPTTIRANTIKTSREKLFKQLKEKEDVRLGKSSSNAIHFSRRVNFLGMPEFKAGLFEVQDEASQLAANMVSITPGEKLLDYCAGSGGKTLAIAPKTEGKGQLFLHDVRSFALEEAKKRMKRAGVQNGQIVKPEELDKKGLKGNMDWVLVDAPCSGSGTLRRNPDMKWRFSSTALEETISLQREIFAKALAFVKKGGHIVYATCSVFPMENDDQITYFTENHPVKLTDIKPFSSFPQKGGMDGFYAAVLQKW